MSPDVREVNAIEKKSDVSKIETNPDQFEEQPELGAAKLNQETTRLEIDPNLCSIKSDYEMLSDIFNFKDLMDQ